MVVIAPCLLIGKKRLNYLKETGTTELVPFEIELWFREGNEARRSAEQHLSSVILKCGGEVSNAFLFEEIGYHALIGYLPATEVQAILDSQGQHIELMQCDEVMFFRPVGQCVVSPSEGDGLEEAREFKSNEQSLRGITELPQVNQRYSMPCHSQGGFILGRLWHLEPQA